MNGLIHRLTLFIATALGLVAALLLGYLVTGAEGNVVRVLSMVASAAAFTWSVVRPMSGLRILVLMAATLDLAKRFLIIYEDFSMGDVAVVLSVAPVTMVGVLIGCMFHPLLTGHRMSPTQVRLVGFSFFVAGASVVLHYLTSHSLKTAVTDSANDGAYVLLLPIVYSLFHGKTQQEVQRFLSFCLAVFVPVGLYGCWQFFAGFNDLEVEYLKSGLTSTGATVYEARPRPFSTLNSVTSFSVVMWFCMALAFYFCFCHRWRGKFMDWVRPVVFFVGMVLSFARGAIVFGFLNLGALYVFRSPKWTRFCYLFGVTTFVLMVLNAGAIRENLDVVQSLLPQGQGVASERFLTIYTFSDRLMGYQNVLTNPSAWSLFGKGVNPLEEDQAGGLYSHDALSQIILSRGVVFALGLLTAIALILRWAHRRVYDMPGVNGRNLTAFLLSAIVLTLASNMAGYILHIYPINLFFWMFIGFFYTVVSGPGMPESPDEPAAWEDDVPAESLAAADEFALAPAGSARR